MPLPDNYPLCASQLSIDGLLLYDNFRQQRRELHKFEDTTYTIIR